MKKTMLLLLLLMGSRVAFCQQNKELTISFEVLFNKKAVLLQDAVYVLSSGNSIYFNTIKFYVSNLQLLKNELVVFTELESFHLVDLADTASQNILLKIPSTLSFDNMQFSLGIDSAANVSGARNGDLDPTKGMYWAWQSGYINVKLEGSCSANRSPTTAFQFHLGGYQSPFNAIQSVNLNIIPNKKNIAIAMNAEKFFNAINFTKQPHIMSPNLAAVILSKELASCFNIANQ